MRPLDPEVGDAGQAAFEPRQCASVERNRIGRHRPRGRTGPVSTSCSSRWLFG